jgi:hypothetical protein
MSDTPETDVLLSNQVFYRIPPDECCDQLQTLCERLERELNQMRKALEKIASLDTSQDASPQQCGAVLIAMNALNK